MERAKIWEFVPPNLFNGIEFAKLIRKMSENDLVELLNYMRTRPLKLPESEKDNKNLSLAFYSVNMGFRFIIAAIELELATRSSLIPVPDNSDEYFNCEDSIRDFKLYAARLTGEKIAFVW